jgi:HEAT repeat protein
MSKSRMNFALVIALVFTCSVPPCFLAKAGTGGQTIPPAGSEDKLIAVLKSDASHKEKADACRQLAIIGTKKAVAPLAALLGDEKLSHMARYGLEPIPDPAVDEAFRDALGKLEGDPLVGVIGSIGVRRDVKAVPALAKLLHRPGVAQAASRALGSIGTAEAAKALIGALVADSTTINALARYEGLLRCAERLVAEGQRDEAVGIYDYLRKLPAPHQVRGGALRGAILTRGKDGLPLLREHVRSDDYILFSAAVQAAQELPGAEVTEALTAGLNELPADNQILVIQTLGKRADAAALPALFSLASSGSKAVRVAAIRALPEIAHPSAVPVLEGLLADADDDISQTAKKSFAALPGREADAAVMSMLSSSETSRRLTALELIGRRRMTAAVGELLKVAREADPKVRPAALSKVGELGGPAQLPALLELLMDFESSQDLNAVRQALSDVCTKADDPQSCAQKLIAPLDKAGPAQKSVLLRVLSVIGGSNALKAVRKAVNDPDPEVHVAAIRALCAWKTAEAAPDLLALAKTADNPNEKRLCLRGYLGLAAHPDLSTGRRLSMCRQAAGLIERDDEKRLLLGALGSIDSPEALAMIMPYLDDAGTRAEACTATVAIAERLLKQRDASKVTPNLIKALEKVAEITTDTNVSRRAKALLRKAQRRARSQ